MSGCRKYSAPLSRRVRPTLLVRRVVGAAFLSEQEWIRLKFTAVLSPPQVLSMIINAAYKPGRVLRELQLVEDPHWNFQEETLKAK